MVLFTINTALQYLSENYKISKTEKEKSLRAEVILTTRTTPNNLFIAICKLKNKKLVYYITRGRDRYSFLKFNNFFSLKKMFTEIVAYTIKYQFIIFKLVSKGRGKIKPLSKEFKKWKVPVFFVINKIRRPFNGCKFPHTRRI